MIHRLKRMLLLVFSLGGLGVLAASLDFDFSSVPNLPAGWRTQHMAPPRLTPDGLHLDITGNDPWLISPPVTDSLTNSACLLIRLRSETAGTAQLFYFQRATEEKESLKFKLPAGAWTDVCLPLPALPAGSRLRFDPPGTNGACAIAWFKVFDAGLGGITQITATSDSLNFELQSIERDCEVVELGVSQSLNDLAQAPVVQRLKAAPSARFTLPRFAPVDGDAARTRDRLYSGFALVHAHPRFGRVPAGPVHFATAFDRIAKFSAPFPATTSKKGLQVQMFDDAIALGVKHAALNVNLTAMVDLARNPANIPWQMDGETYWFNRGYVEHFPVRKLNDAGSAVYFILLTYRSGNPELDRIMLHPGHDRPLPNNLAAFNTATPDGVRYLKACLEFLAHRFGDPAGPHGRVAGYIVGNEVTAHHQWYNLGPAHREDLLPEYLRAVRLTHAAVRKFSSSARVYLSLEHHWTTLNGGDPLRAIAGREFVDGFNRWARLGGDFEWHMAYHPYPENLFQPRTWRDKSATPDFDTRRITFKNLEQLQAYFRQPELLWQGAQRRIILSEQGFHSDNTPEGDTAQAAGYCYAWEKVHRLDGIDAFILHRHVDHSGEGGLNLGLWRRQPDSVATPGTQRPIYQVFRAADTPAREDAFKFALPVIGITNWNQVLQ